MGELLDGELERGRCRPISRLRCHGISKHPYPPRSSRGETPYWHDNTFNLLRASIISQNSPSVKEVTGFGKWTAGTGAWAAIELKISNPTLRPGERKGTVNSGRSAWTRTTTSIGNALERTYIAPVPSGQQQSKKNGRNPQMEKEPWHNYFLSSTKNRTAIEWHWET